jgi:hypothetical protein
MSRGSPRWQIYCSPRRLQPRSEAGGPCNAHCLTDTDSLAVGPRAFVGVASHPHAFIRSACGLFRRLVLRLVGVQIWSP